MFKNTIIFQFHRSFSSSMYIMRTTREKSQVLCKVYQHSKAFVSVLCHCSMTPFYHYLYKVSHNASRKVVNALVKAHISLGKILLHLLQGLQNIGFLSIPVSIFSDIQNFNSGINSGIEILLINAPYITIYIKNINLIKN